MINIRLTQRPSTTSTQAKQILRRELNSAFFVIAGTHIDERAKIYDKFNETQSKPVFVPIVTFGGKAMLQLELTGPNAESAQVTVWELLDQGTKVRFMGVSGWQSKTSAGSLSVGAGAGIKTGLGPPQPGIAKREFDDKINDKLEAEVEEEIGMAIIAGLEAIF